ncbi:MAG TPA: asparagine synthase (glutamine-hydrolyzing) [Bryobacteraceae bacterium]|nr:asparagine synthase (glutamine-hydrolyzing) [Bryobacteraceae bacterium]HOQ43706.1 asparagine synthase (glutamine-hydrolyzing) [Bryobacteraceae bacterium]HPQ14542.1 asparagine synthase (glutamine-hydrolyzing) [Bryobacteraceae bacterium]HPU72432.1 asparagine synthase (glutamine-hydrolyzing) [Bryobacteraceae bacterium]
MCGIAGCVSVNPDPRSPALVERMAALLRHRGPDDRGSYSDTWATLAHRRLSIIDLAAGRQPMSNEDGNLWIVYNGEVFNHAALRPELERAGHRYRTRCDTETILHAYEQYGPGCVDRFRGMFSFAIWDRAARRLFCARDRLGIKPFYYFWDGRLFAFASEIKALLEHPDIRCALEEEALPEYLALGYLSGERTMFSGIRKLMPGHTLTFEPAATRLEIRRYWDLPAQAGGEPEDEAFWISECRRRLEEAVRTRLMSDVPLGVFLSGGVDSSAIAALVRRMVPGPVETFSVGYAEGEFSELGYARQAARAIGSDHHEVVVGLEDFFSALPRLIWHEDEPIAWPSSVSLYFVSRLAASRVKVVLTGEGSDELFAGYARYRFYLMNRKWMSGYRLLPPALRGWIRRQAAASRLLSAGLRRKLGHTFLARGDSLESLYLDNFYCAFSGADQERLFSLPPGPSPYAQYLGYWNARPRVPALDRMLYADSKTYLVELLMKQDQMSMACSIESRVPLLDHTFVEFAARVPARLKIRGRTQKYIFKRAVEDLLPRDIVYRRKMGFPTPLREWLLRPAAAPLIDSLRAPGGLLAEYVNRTELDALLARHSQGIEDATDRIWRLLNLQLWGEVFLTGRLKPSQAAETAR